jgi:hypothetical protein
MDKYTTFIPEDDAVNASEELRDLIERVRRGDSEAAETLIRDLPALCDRARLNYDIIKARLTDLLAPAGARR